MDGYVNKIKNSLISSDIKIERTYIHPEESGNSKLNKAISTGYEDIQVIDTSIKDLAIKTDELLNRTVKRLDTVKNIITSEKERLQDISMLCNLKTDYDNAIPLKDNDFNGDCTYEDGVFYSKLNSSLSVKAIVDDISGNGYEGNKYVIKDNKYLDTILNTSIRNTILDNNISTYYEYSRITASSNEPYLISDFNKDDAEAKCTVTLKFASLANEIAIKSSIDTIKVVGIRHSNDGITYEDVVMLPFIINNKDESYKNQDYIYGSNIISFPSCKYLKITFESIGYTNDILAFERTVANDEDVIDKNTTIVPTAKRHIIKLNDIAIKAKTFATESTMTSKELISTDTDVYAISIFANTYLPKGLSPSSIKFILSINGIDYDILPVNSHENGIKIIRFSHGKMPAEYTHYIGEKIQSAKLTVILKSRGQLSPYLNNLKVLIGGAV